MGVVTGEVGGGTVGNGFATGNPGVGVTGVFWGKSIDNFMISKTLKENKNKPLWCFCWIVIFGLPLALVLSFFLAFTGRIYPRVSVCQISLTGKRQKDASFLLVKSLPVNTLPIITLTAQLQTFTLDLNSFKFLPEVTGQKAIKVGRDGSWRNKLKELFITFRRGKNLPFSFQLSETQLESEIASVSAQINEPAIEPTIKILSQNGIKKIIVDSGKDGLEINVNELKQNILTSLSCPQKEIVLPIPILTISPKISSAQAEETQKRANLLLGKNIALTLNEQKWTVNDEEIISFLSFYGGFDRLKINDYGQNLGKTVNAPPENAAFQFDTGRVSLFRPSKDGVSLEEDQFSEEFEKALVALEESEQSQTLPLPIKITPPQITMANVNTLGIQELLGRGTSLFFGSIPGRIHNIDLASLKLNGILVAPGETFSFNKSLGDVSANTGFEQAYIIKEGRTILGDGGGVCQVSTTLFRAALNSGLPILERHAHAYRVHYYEDDLGPGIDATVFDPSADLKIQNNTPAYLLIQSSVDLKKKKLTFEIYGTSDNRQVEMSKVRVWDQVPPPPDLYQDDPTLVVGTVKQIDWKAWGAKAAFDYKVTRGGEVLTEKTFTSNYRPWQAIFLRGTRI